MRIFVIGHTGFIGKAVFEKLYNPNHELVGVNSRYIEFKGNTLIPRSSSLVNDLENLIEPDSVILNTSWCATDRESRNSEKHSLMAEVEISLIQYVSHLNLRYLSLGSIAEIMDSEITDAASSNYAISKRKVFEYLQHNNENFAWMRIASCFGKNDTRDWIINELKRNKHRKLIVVRNSENLINLSSVENIANVLISNLFKSIKGEFNLMDKHWYKIGNLVDSVYEGVDLIPVLRSKGKFSENDPNKMLTGNNDVLGFLRS